MAQEHETIEQVVELLDGDTVVGQMTVHTEVESHGELANENVMFASVAESALRFRVNGEVFTSEDIKEWWA